MANLKLYCINAVVYFTYYDYRDHASSPILHIINFDDIFFPLYYNITGNLGIFYELKAWVHELMGRLSKEI